MSAEREPRMGVWGWSPQRGPGAKPLVMGSGGEAESCLRIGHPKEVANWPRVRVLNETNCNFGEGAL